MARTERPTQAMYAAIGRTAAESARVEQNLRELFALLIESPYGRVLAAGEDISRLQQMCLRVARYNKKITEAQLEQLIAIDRAITAARPQRNFLVHSVWYRMKTPGEHYGERSSRPATSQNGASTSEHAVWTLDDAKEVADYYEKIAGHLERFMDQTFEGVRIPLVMSRAQEENIRERWEKLMGNAGQLPCDWSNSFPL